MTIGEDRVRIKFNPSDNTLVSQLKQKTAELIDLCETMRSVPHDSQAAANEAARLIALAETYFEDAAMWAVKAATA